MRERDKKSHTAKVQIRRAGNFVADAFHFVGLFILMLLTLWGSVSFTLGALADWSVNIDEILLLFIFIEIGSMIGIYFKSNHLPVRFLIFIGITALTRYLIGIISHHQESGPSVLYPCIGILLLAAAILITEFASRHAAGFPLTNAPKETERDRPQGP